MDTKRLTELSKFLSFVLRHQPGAIGVELDAAGWIEIERLLDACRAHGRPIERDVLAMIVATSPKQGAPDATYHVIWRAGLASRGTQVLRDLILTAAR